MLAALTDVLDDRTISTRLARATRAEDVVAALTHATDAGTSAEAKVGSGTRQVEVRILGAAGLHARPATVFVGIAARFDAEIRVQYAGRTANGKALASLLTLGAGVGAALCIFATGPEAEAALAALRAAVESGLGDEEAPEVPADAQAWSPPPGIHAVTGIAAAPGVAIGPLFQFRAARVVAADRPRTIRPRSATTWPRRWRPRASSSATSTTR